MKAKIHPQWYPEAKIICACGKSFITGTTKPEIQVEICSMCHPFYTGQMKYIDTAGRVEAFKSRIANASTKRVTKTDKRKAKKLKQLQEEMERPDTLEALRKNG